MEHSMTIEHNGRTITLTAFLGGYTVRVDGLKVGCIEKTRRGYRTPDGVKHAHNVAAACALVDDVFVARH
jgi:hypothetical protein